MDIGGDGVGLPRWSFAWWKETGFGNIGSRSLRCRSSNASGGSGRSLLTHPAVCIEVRCLE